MPTPADPPPGTLPRNFLRPCLLLLLRENPSHGYDLLERLEPLGFTRDAGRLYRALRALEEEGFVRSAWEVSVTGPDRRIYHLSRAGMKELHSGALDLVATHGILNSFLSRYAEFVALDFERSPTAKPR
jgi:poly-beta-hydroxybutyrate-responsive repressor